MNIKVCWFVDIENNEAIDTNNLICYINTEISYKFSSQLIKHLVENAGYVYRRYMDFPNRDPYKDQNIIYLSLPTKKNNQ